MTDAQISKELVGSFSKLGEGDSLRIAAFYLSKRKVVRSILKAAKNGADVKIILDPNRHGFGYEKYGTPNQPVAHELLKKVADGQLTSSNLIGLQYCLGRIQKASFRF